VTYPTGFASKVKKVVRENVARAPSGIEGCALRLAVKVDDVGPQTPRVADGSDLKLNGLERGGHDASNWANLNSVDLRDSLSFVRRVYDHLMTGQHLDAGKLHYSPLDGTPKWMQHMGSGDADVNDTPALVGTGIRHAWSYPASSQGIDHDPAEFFHVSHAMLCPADRRILSLLIDDRPSIVRP
jgi:hypothetical protein